MNTDLNSGSTVSAETEDHFAVSARGLGKCYQIYRFPKDKLKEVLLMGRVTYHRPFWALRNVSFDLKRGETVGIVGRNGSGKSTLLQIICGTVAPTSGTVDIYGRVSALLELGSGFSPEFTGKENVYMNATIMGLSRKEIDERYDEIVEFADIGDFIDQPVRMYSSGMYVRLAFAVASNVEPQILVVDEALAVGDEIFQRKCFARIRTLRKKGCSILFVSHWAGRVIEFCDRAMLLDRGECILSGDPKQVVANYHRLVSAPHHDQDRLREEILSLKEMSTQRQEKGSAESKQSVNMYQALGYAFFDPALVPKTTIRYVSRGAEILDPKITTLDGDPVNNLLSGQDYLCCYRVKFHDDAASVRFGMVIKTTTGAELGGAMNVPLEDATATVPAGTTIDMSFKFSCALLPGVYFLNCSVLGNIGGVEQFLDQLIDAAMFRVLQGQVLRATGTVDFGISQWNPGDVDAISSE